MGKQRQEVRRRGVGGVTCSAARVEGIGWSRISGTCGEKGWRASHAALLVWSGWVEEERTGGLGFTVQGLGVRAAFQAHGREPIGRMIGPP